MTPFQGRWSNIENSSSTRPTSNSYINDIFNSPVVKAVIPGYFSQDLTQEFAIIKQNTIEFHSTQLKDNIFQCVCIHRLTHTVVDAVGLSIKAELNSEIWNTEKLDPPNGQGRDVILLSLDTGQIVLGLLCQSMHGKDGLHFDLYPWALHDPSNNEAGFGYRQSLYNGESHEVARRQHIQQILRLFASTDGKSFGVISESTAWICPFQINQGKPRLHMTSVESRNSSYVAFAGFTIHVKEFILHACLLGCNSSEQYIHLLILARTLETAGQEDTQSTVKMILFEALPLKVEPSGQVVVEETENLMLPAPNFTIKQYPPYPIKHQYESTLFLAPIAKSSAAAAILSNDVLIVTPHEIMSAVTDLTIQSLNASSGSLPSAVYSQKGESGLFLGFDDGLVVYFYVDGFGDPKVRNITRLPVQIGPGFAILNDVVEEHLIIVAGGESSNGGVFAISAQNDIPLLMMNLPCWTPVADVTSRRRKDKYSEDVEESMALVIRPDTFYLASGLGQFGSVQELTKAVGSQLNMLGPEVKGAAKVFPLCANENEVALCVSYPWGSSLYVFEQSSESLIDLQDNHHFCGASETLAMGVIEVDTEGGRYLSAVQVTRKGIHFAKFNREEDFQSSLTAETSTISGQFIHATIKGNLIATISRENSTSQVVVYKVNDTDGFDEISFKISQVYSLEEEISILTALGPNNNKGSLVVGSRSGRIIALEISEDTQDSHQLILTDMEICHCHPLKDNVPPCSIVLLSETVLLVGFRNGELRFYKKQNISRDAPIAPANRVRHLQDMFDEPENVNLKRKTSHERDSEFLLVATYKFKDLPVDLIECPYPGEVLILGSGEIWKAKPCDDELKILPLRLGNEWSENVADLCFIGQADSTDQSRLQHDFFCIQMDRLCLFTFCPCLYPDGIWTRTFEIGATPFRVLYLSHGDMIAVISRLSEGDNGKSPLAFIDRRLGTIISDATLIDSRKQTTKDGLTVNETLFARGEYARCFCEWRINIGGNTYVYLVVGGGKPGHMSGFHRNEWGKVRILRISRKGSEGKVVLKCQMSWTCENPVVGIAAIGDYSLAYIQGESLEIKSLNPETLKFVLSTVHATIRPLRPILSACEDEIVCLGDAPAKLRIIQLDNDRLTTLESIAVEDIVIRGVLFPEEQCLLVTTFNGLVRIFVKDIDGRYRDSRTLLATNLSSAQTGVCQGRLAVSWKSQKHRSLITVGVDGQISQIEMPSG